MNSTFLYDAQSPVAGRGLGYSYDPNGGLRATDQSSTSATMGDGCVYTTPSDYLKWFQALRSNTLVPYSKYLSATAFTISATGSSTSQASQYGPGWFMSVGDGSTDTESDVELTHTGSTCGFSNIVLCNLERDQLILVFSNVAGVHDGMTELIVKCNDLLSQPLGIDWTGFHRLTD